MKLLITIGLILNATSLLGQKRLELLETNIPMEKITPYSDSYLWAKNWWLTSGMIVDTTKGGNTFAKSSSLSRSYIDSVGKIFRNLISTDVIRFGNLIPRFTYAKSNKQAPFIKASIYEINDSSAKLIIQYLLEFAGSKHNGMMDVSNITILDPESVIPISFIKAKEIYQRKPNEIELDITPPQVSNK